MKATKKLQAHRDRVRIKSGDTIWTASVRELKVNAAAGNPESECTLGYLYSIGRGVPINLKRAVHFYRRAAQKGHVIATCNLAMCYCNGEGVRKDLQKALKLFRTAALKGDHQAQCDLGIMYRFGEGVRRNRKRALYWLRLAARADVVEALYHLGDGHVNSGNLKIATRYMRRAAALGHRRAKRWLVKGHQAR